MATDKEDDPKQSEETEFEKLIKEKIRLAKKLHLWDEGTPVEGYREMKEYARIQEIDLRLWELV